MKKIKMENQHSRNISGWNEKVEENKATFNAKKRERQKKVQREGKVKKKKMEKEAEDGRLAAEGR